MVKANDMKTWSFGMSHWTWPPFWFEKKLDEIFPKDDARKNVLRFMIELGICGISALAYSKKHRSTSESARNLDNLLDKIPLLVKIQNPLLIIGESGTGKENMAKLLHYVGKGKDKPFISVNCSAIPKSMLESELFGHTKGAFTDAKEEKTGLIEMAKGGSIFLDELGKMENDLQYKLLRVIEGWIIRRLGSTTDIPVEDVQFIIAIQPADIENENIAPDLLNRLNIYNAITLPSLSERLRGDPDLIHSIFLKLQKETNITDEKGKEEIKKLENEMKDVWNLLDADGKKKNGGIATLQTQKLLSKYKRLCGKHLALTAPLTLSDKVVQKLFYYKGYEGKNFRELENILKHARIRAHIAKRKEIIIEDLPEKVRDNHVDQENSKSDTLKDIKTIHLSEIIDYADKMKKDIVNEKIKDVKNTGSNIMATLRAEGKALEYQAFRKKLERVLGKGFWKNLQ